MFDYLRYKTMEHGDFATVINCMDGRVQIQVIEWIKKHHPVQHVDVITEPGPDRILAEKQNIAQLESIRYRVDISITKHHSKLIVVTGHYDCAGNPVEKDQHIMHILEALKTIDSWNYAVPAIGLWIDESWSVCTLY